jgi:hypothetical protein
MTFPDKGNVCYGSDDFFRQIAPFQEDQQVGLIEPGIFQQGAEYIRGEIVEKREDSVPISRKRLVQPAG